MRHANSRTAMGPASDATCSSHTSIVSIARRRFRLSPVTSFIVVFVSLLPLMTLSTAATADFDYDEMTRALKEQHIIHSAAQFVAKSRPCLEMADKNVTIAKAVSKLSKRLTVVNPLHRFNVAFCAAEALGEDSAIAAMPQCAPNSRCTTVYKWVEALVQPHPNTEPTIYVQDEILIPTGCMCFLGADSDEDAAPLIIL